MCLANINLCVIFGFKIICRNKQNKNKTKKDGVNDGDKVIGISFVILCHRKNIFVHEGYVITLCIHLLFLRKSLLFYLIYVLNLF